MVLGRESYQPAEDLVQLGYLLNFFKTLHSGNRSYDSQGCAANQSGVMLGLYWKSPSPLGLINF